MFNINEISKFIVDQIIRFIGIIVNIPKPNIDISGINHLSDNQIVFNLVIFLHLLYIFLLNYCMKMDKIDNFMYKKVIQINDIPLGIYKYLVSIYTNWRPKSGTRSKIFLQLHGSLCQNTVCYLLHNPFLPYRELFVWSDISFFVINTANPVGDIQALTIGHDDSVNSSWFLSKVLIKDLQINKEYRFFAHCWLLNDRQNLAELHSSVTLEPVDPSYVEPFGERVFQWVRRCFRERPLTSFFYLNFLTLQSRVTRLNITYFYVIVSMLVNMMYFDKRNHDLYNILITSSVKAVASYLLLLFLQLVLNFDCFTTLYPTKRQFQIRIIVYICLSVTYLALVFYLLAISTLYKNDIRSTLTWLGLFLLGLIQSEFFYSLIAAFSKAILYTFFLKDPFAEEASRITFTYKNRSFNRSDI